jgi:hypothetical protein
MVAAALRGQDMSIDIEGIGAERYKTYRIYRKDLV